jgi:hypothetical protein
MRIPDGCCIAKAFWTFRVESVAQGALRRLLTSRSADVLSASHFVSRALHSAFSAPRGGLLPDAWRGPGAPRFATHRSDRWRSVP